MVAVRTWNDLAVFEIGAYINATRSLLFTDKVWRVGCTCGNGRNFSAMIIL